MKKILLILCLLLIPSNINAISLPETYSNNVLIYDLTDDLVLLERNSENKANIASLTKIMTTLTAIEKNPDLKEQFLLTDAVFYGIPFDASVAGLKVGDNLTIEDLLYASILPSGADATQALAIKSSSSVPAFVKEMNDLAKSIGCENTYFKNVTGLDEEGHYSTASDILKILKYALQNPTFKRIFCTKEYTLTNGLIVNSTLKAYNKNLNLDTSKILGSKTGYTSKSGLCLAALTKVHEHDIIIITLNAPPVIKMAYNIKDALNLIEYLNINYNNQVLIDNEIPIKTLPVDLAKIDFYDIKPTKTITRFLPNDYNKELIKIEYTGENRLSYKSKSKIGHIKYYYNKVLLDEEDVILTTKLELDIIKVIKKYKIIIILAIFIIIALFYLRTKKSKRKYKKKSNFLKT